MNSIELKHPSEWTSSLPSKGHGLKGAENGHSIITPSYTDRVWDACKSEFDFLKNIRSSDYFSNNTCKILLGLGVGVLMFVTFGQLDAISSVLGGEQAGGMSAISLAISIAQLPMSLASAMIKVSFLAVYAFVTPYVEEFLFRGIIHDFMGGEVGTKIEKGLKVLANAFLFALYHIPSLLPQISILILLELFVLGSVLATLRLCTENRAASTAAHITFNSLVFGTIFALA